MECREKDLVNSIDWVYKLMELVEHGLADLHVLETSILNQAAKIRQHKRQKGKFNG